MGAGNGQRDEVVAQLVINLHRGGGVSVQAPAMQGGGFNRPLCYNMLGQAHEIMMVQAAMSKLGPKPMIVPARLMPPADVGG